MNATLLRINWLNLKRDRIALGLTFILPLIFFSIFAFIFSNMGGGEGESTTGPSGVRVLVVDLDGTQMSRRFVDAMRATDGLRVETAPPPSEANPSPPPYTETRAREIVRAGEAPALALIPPGFGEHFGDFGADGPPITVIYDASDLVARHAVAGLMQGAAFQAAPDVLMERGLESLNTFGGAPLTEQQRAAIEQIRPFLRGEKPWQELDDSADSDDAAANKNPLASGLVRVEMLDVRAGDAPAAAPPRYPMIPYYAAGIGVMFLLFSMAGAAGSLLEEQEAGALDRLLTSRVSMTRLLVSKWAFFALIGFAQIVIMFTWGATAFGLDLWTVNHLVGFTLVALVTAAAASGFGLLLATICKTRAQLGGMSTIVILIMSAVGGSMVPRIFMPDAMKLAGKFTFNGQALDGFLKVFWNDNPNATLLASLVSLAPHLAIITALAVAFLIAARLAARRWEAA